MLDRGDFVARQAHGRENHVRELAFLLQFAALEETVVFSPPEPRQLSRRWASRFS